MAQLEDKESFKSLDSAFGYNCQEAAPEMSEKGEDVRLVTETSGKSKKFNGFLRRTNSERNHAKQEKDKHGKSRTFSSIFLKKKAEEKRGSEKNLESKSSQTNLASTKYAVQAECGVQNAEIEELKTENSNLRKTLHDKEDFISQLETDMDETAAKVKDLRLELEESRLNNALVRGTKRENDILQKRLEVLADDKETLEFHMAFLEEEKLDAEKRKNELLEEVRKYQGKLDKCEDEREKYKQKFLQAKSHARQVISEYIGDVNELIQENRYLIKKGLRGKPKELEKIMKVTDEYLQLQAEKNRILESNELLTERAALQEVELAELRRELGNAVIHLEQAGVSWRPVLEEVCDRDKREETLDEEEEFSSPREDQPTAEKIEIPLSIAETRPVKQAAGKITVL